MKLILIFRKRKIIELEVVGEKMLFNNVLKKKLITEDNTENIKTVDFGLSFGLGIQIPLGDMLLLDTGLREDLARIIHE